MALAGLLQRQIKPFGRRLLRYFPSRRGIVQRKNLWLREPISSLSAPGSDCSFSGLQFPMLKVFEATRVPGFKSWSSFGRSLKLMLGNRTGSRPWPREN
jgi:hypothetical protein